jgi:1-acyl-sn-glycerol-3-phosphate acyltransferase
MFVRNFEEFAILLRSGQPYETPGDFRPNFVNRWLGRFDWWYYSQMVRFVLRAARKARENRYDILACARTSFQSLRNVESCGGRIFITETRHPAAVPGPAVFIANHMSMLETFLFPSILAAFNPTGVAMVVKQSLLEYPAFGPVLRSIHPISVGRKNPRDDLAAVMEGGEQAARDGRSIMVFPQATRKTVIHEDDFNSIGVKLARRAGVPLVPIAIRTDFQGFGGLLKDFGPLERSRTVRVEFAPAMTIQGNGRAEHEQSVRFIVEKVTLWQKQEPQ